MNNNNNGPCRILVIGSPRARVIKVISILQQQSQYSTCQIPSPPLKQDNDILPEQQQEQQKPINQPTNQEEQNETYINIEYIPCVAKFGSYRNENKELIRYLLRVDYFGKDCTNTESSTLLEFFDHTNTPTTTDDNQDESILLNSVNENTTSTCTTDAISIDKVLSVVPIFPKIEPILIVGAVIIGLDSPDVCNEKNDTTMIQKFIQTISNNRTIPIETIQPTSPYMSMVEEFNAIKLMTQDVKQNLSITIGPNKMAQFAYTFATTLILTRYQQLVDKIILHNSKIEENKQKQIDAMSISTIDNQPVDNKSNRVLTPNFINTSINRYACKKCRCIIFDKNDLENPPHIPSTHKFSYRKQRHSGYISTTTTIGNGSTENNNGGDLCDNNGDNDTTTNDTNDQCQSYFLQEDCYILNSNISTSIDNNSDDNYSSTEGKLVCPKCKQKLGNYNWSGAQCSCGTWTVPAIQIPKSKVDIICPI